MMVSVTYVLQIVTTQTGSKHESSLAVNHCTYFFPKCGEGNWKGRDFTSLLPHLIDDARLLTEGVRHRNDYGNCGLRSILKASEIYFFRRTVGIVIFTVLVLQFPNST